MAKGHRTISWFPTTRKRDDTMMTPEQKTTKRDLKYKFGTVFGPIPAACGLWVVATCGIIQWFFKRPPAIGLYSDKAKSLVLNAAFTRIAWFKHYSGSGVTRSFGVLIAYLNRKIRLLYSTVYNRVLEIPKEAESVDVISEDLVVIGFNDCNVMSA